jgi:hypothetical protein
MVKLSVESVNIYGYRFYIGGEGRRERVVM